MRSVGSTRKTFVLAGTLLAWCPCAVALNPSFEVSQYAHTTWKGRDGFPRGSVRAIVQTEDGYLWIGTEFGLVRFDGLRPTPWQPPASQQLPSDSIMGLHAARDGTLWIGTWQGLASWKNGKLTQYHELDGLVVMPILEDREGVVWAGGFAPTPPGKLCAIHNGAVQCYGADGSLGNGVVGLYEDRKGNLWAGTRTGLWRWKPGFPQFYSFPVTSEGIEGLGEDDKGLLIAQIGRVARLVRGKQETAYRYTRSARNSRGFKILRDRGGGLWVGTRDRGIVRVHQGRTDTFSQIDGLSGNLVTAFLEDREGNIWVATPAGLDRFRDYAVVTFSAGQGLGGLRGFSVVAAGDGAIWVMTSDGLSKWKNGHVTVLHGVRPGQGAEPCLIQDHAGRIWVAGSEGLGYVENDRFVRVEGVPGGFVYSMGEDSDGNLWITNQVRGLLEVRDGRFVQQVPWTRMGHTDYALSLAADPSGGGLWLGFYDGGLAQFRHGRIRASYGAADGLGKGAVKGLQFDHEGTLWVATDGGLSRLRNGRVTTLTSKDGLPCDTVHWVMEDDAHWLWLHTACGLVRITRSELDAWSFDPKRKIEPLVLGNTDGVQSKNPAPNAGPSVAKAPDGKIWFTIYDGLSVFDPRHLPVNKLPPPVHIEQIVANGKAVSNSRLPALTRDLEIDYTGLSFVAPEKVRFKYKLEGRDTGWKDAGNRRQAFYSELPPRSYRFRVIASNNCGVWNEGGDTFDFSIDPAYYQTTWFKAACVAAFLALLWALHRYRLHQVAREFNAELEGRVDERTRIARELHDTLLQSFQGLMLRFQAAFNELPARPSEAREALGSALDYAAQAITEGRNAVQGLRFSTVETNDLALALTALVEQLAASETNGDGVESFVEVEGTPRDLHPILRDDIYRIAAEAMRNAFRHAQARRIEVAIGYGQRQFVLSVRDDGKGIDPEVLGEQGRRGHWGLAGMRERAELIGGHLEVSSELQSGTEVKLSIPASLVYATSPARRRSRLFARKTGTNP